MKKYEEDPNWMECMDKNRCPYENCEGHIDKQGIKSSCTNCQLIIYGSPLLLMYRERETEIKTLEQVECLHQKTHYAIEEQELVCMQCGEVLAGRPHYVAGQLKVKYRFGYIFDDTQHNKP